MRPIVNIKSKYFNITDKLLGAGSFSLVKIAFRKGDKIPIALKICHCNSNSEWLQSLNEICLLKKLSHKNVATINGYEITRFHVLIGLNKGEGTLKQFIASRTQNELHTFCLLIMGQLISALNYIHSFKIIHGDIKPSNMIYTLKGKELNIQIMDFGLSHVVGREDEPGVGDAGGTKSYLAPERLSHSKYDETSDLFSAGIVFFEILFKKHPFYKEGDNYAEVMKNKPDPNFPLGYQTQISKDWLLVLCSMLSYNPNTRKEVRNSSLFRTKFIATNVDHQILGIQNISEAEKEEKNEKYSNAALLFMEACINLGISSHETNTENTDSIKELIIQYRKKILHLIHLYKHSYSQFESIDSSNIHDEFYDYLMEVTASTPNLRHYLEIGYNGELYYKERKNDIAFKSFMDALQYLNGAIQSEPPGDRKTIIGKKMLQWTTIAETLQNSS